ncbi:hypothetical protein C8R43DRAFT_1118963 [Mycena crocata]|nr:hypothetical protein C8R43DRAFT_1118963 [Mycena crocata]
MSRDELSQIMGEAGTAEKPAQGPRLPEEPRPEPNGSHRSGHGPHPAKGSTPVNQDPDEQRPHDGSDGFKEVVTEHRKPKGAPNKPNSGGYSMEEYLEKTHEWTQGEFRTVRNAVHKFAAAKLDINICYQEQQKGRIQHVWELVKKRFAIARGYEDCWVIKDMLKVHLKTTSATYRRRVQAKERRQSSTETD